MVTVQEARQQLTTQKQELQSQRQIIQRISIPTLTAVQVRQQTRSSLAQRQLQSQELQSRKQSALKQLLPFEKGLTDFEKQIKNVEAQISKQKAEIGKFEQARKLITEGKTLAARGDPGLQKAIRDLQARGAKSGAEIRAASERFKADKEAAIKSLEAKGFKPIFVNGQLKGLEDVIKQQSIGFKEAEGIQTLKPQLIIPLPKADIITFGQPEKFAESFRQATGSTSFTLAIPIKRENGKLRVQDFNFRFENGKLVKSTPTGTALLTEKQFLAADARRRLKAPGFTFGSTVLTPLPKADIIIPQISQKEFQGIISKGGKKLQELGKKATSGLETGREATLKTIFPFFKKESNLVNSENKRLQNEFGRLNNSINNFNSKFGDKDLNETQFKQAENQRVILDKNIEKFLNLQDKTEENRTRRTNDRQRLFFEEAVKSAGVGAVSLVFDIPRLVIGAVTQPIKTLGDIKRGAEQFPQQFATQPATVLGFLGGQVLSGTSIIKAPGVITRPKPKITKTDLNSQIILSGTAKEKVIRNVANLDNEFRILNDQGKITSTIAYRINTADGRSFEVIEFSKSVGVGLEKELIGVREILAFEIKKPGQVGEVLVGRAGQKITGQAGQSFVDLIRFKIPKTAVGRLRQSITGRPAAKRFEILQKSKLETSKTIGGITKITERTEAGIVRVSNAQRSITRNALRFAEQLRKGRSIESVLGLNLSKLRSLINVERRLKGKRIFNQKEFEATFSKTLSQSELLRILDDISIVGLVKETPIGIGLRLVGKRKVGFAGGADIKRLPEPFPKLKRKPTLEKAFVKEKVAVIKPTIKKLKDKFGRFREAKLVTQDKVRGAKAPQLKAQLLIKRKPSIDLFPKAEIVRLPPVSVAPSVSLALTRPLTSFGSPARIVTKSATGLKSSFALIPSLKSISALKLRITQLQKTRQEIIQIPRTQQTTFTVSRLVTLQKIIQLQKSKLTQLQRIKQLARLTPVKPITPGLPLIIIPPLVKEGVKKKLLVKAFKPKGKGYNVFVRSRNKLIRANINPIAKQKALDLGAFVTDRTLSQRFKIVKTNKNAKVPKVRVPLSYFGVTRGKWRGKIIKGKEFPIKKNIFERRKAAIDTLGEKRKLRAARLISDLKRKARRTKPFKFKRI